MPNKSLARTFVTVGGGGGSVGPVGLTEAHHTEWAFALFFGGFGPMVPFHRFNSNLGHLRPVLDHCKPW